MIIAYTAGARTGNQLYHFLYLLAASLEYNLPFRLIAFSSCSSFEFKADSARVCSSRPLMSKLIRKMRRVLMAPLVAPLSRACGCSYLIEYDAQRSLTPELAKSKGKILFMDCWPYIDAELLHKHSETVRLYIQPRQEARNRAAEIIHALRSAAAVPVVGVHIRRTDYKEWLDGIYYYELETYLRYMKRVSELLEGEVSFVICSDEHFEAGDFADVPCRGIHVSHETFMTDFALLMQCDYTMGPPSTFRMTSSFLGNTPSFRMSSADTPCPSMEAFRMPLIEEY